MERYDENIGLMMDKLKISKSDIPMFVYDYIVEIEKYATELETNQREAHETFKKAKFNASTVSKVLECSRTTLYNNNILKEYITIREIELRKNNLLTEINDLKTNIKDLRNNIDALERRDLEIEIVALEADNLTKELKTLNVEVEKLRADNAIKDKEIRKQRKQLMSMK